MVGAIINTIGILLVAVGTIFTLWTILTTKTKEAGTYGELARRHQDFPKEKKGLLLDV